MTAIHEITIKFTIAQEVDNVTDILDIHDVAQTAACCLADKLTDFKCTTSFEILEGKMDAK